MTKLSLARRWRSRFIAGSIGIAMALGAPAGAQLSLFRGMEANRPAMSTGDLKRHAKVLRLTEAQTEAAKSLVASYTAEFEQASKERRDKMREINEEFQDSRDFSVMEQMGPVEEKFQKRADELEKTLLSDLRSILTPEQDSTWPKFERTRRREKSIGKGSLSGESVDLVRIVEDLELNDSARKPLTDTIELYEVDLDRALDARNKVMESQSDMFPKPGAGGSFAIDMDAIQEASKKVREAGTKVREVNQRYARTLEGLLSEDVRPKFQLAVKRQSFPQVYRESRTEAAFNAALKFDDLDAKQREAITAAREQFVRENDVACDKLAQAIVEDEESGSNMGFGGMMISFGEDNKDTPISQARKAKRELEKKSLDGLKSLLTEKQIEKLPKREEREPVEVGGARMMIQMDGR
ncbi:MAG: hypothetical protein AB7G11_06210 [Phycisphaerales bacterium]